MKNWFLLTLATLAVANEVLVPAQVSAQATPARVVLTVPWLPQVPPGDWDNTKNCGQTCAAMVYGYYANLSPSSAQITANNQWLAVKFNDNRYTATPNGWYTNFGNRNELGALLTQKYGLKYSVTTAANFNSIATQVASGRPVIACVMIKGGNLVASGGIPHWALVVGYDGPRGLVYVNDPGSNRGDHRSYDLATFNATWASQGRVMAPVWK